MIYSGLQDNIATSDLAELQPAFVQQVTYVRDTILGRLEAAFASSGIDVDINEFTGEVVMSNSILFDKNEYLLSEEGKAYVDKFLNIYASILLSEEFADFISEIAVEGHTDTVGSESYNQVLSQQRADSVKQWCFESSSNTLTAKQKERMKDIMSAKGYSFRFPIFDGFGNIDMDASRRVSIKFFIDMDQVLK